jgi:uncharacterized membrane protein
LRRWTEAGLLQPGQAEAILSHRRSEATKNAVSATTLLSGPGGLFVVPGIVLIIFFNWERIPSFVKMGAYLLVLAAVAEAYARVPERFPIARSAILVGWLLLPLGGIGLRRQIYQLSGDPFKPLFIALLLGLPLVLFTRHGLVAALYVYGVLQALTSGTFHPGTWVSLGGHRWLFDASSAPFGTPQVRAVLLIAARLALEAVRVAGHRRPSRIPPRHPSGGRAADDGSWPFPRGNRVF